jgi:methionyl-tRNA formyltransferase
LEQPAKLRGNAAFHETLAGLELDAAVTAAYGKILPAKLLAVPRHGFLNVHASLLPKYRGAAPIQWALINGESETGVSIMQTEAGLDTGPVRHVRRLDIQPEDTALTLFEKLAALGAKAIVEALDSLAEGRLPCRPQDDAHATHAPPLTKDDGRIRWDESARAICDRYRGVLAWPGSWTERQGQPLKVHRLSRVEDRNPDARPGEVFSVTPEGVTVAAGAGSVLLQEVQPPNKARMSAQAWANGYRVKAGERLG